MIVVEKRRLEVDPFLPFQGQFSSFVDPRFMTPTVTKKKWASLPMERKEITPYLPIM